jgi:hypothetical protein
VGGSAGRLVRARVAAIRRRLGDPLRLEDEATLDVACDAESRARGVRAVPQRSRDLEQERMPLAEGDRRSQPIGDARPFISRRFRVCKLPARQSPELTRVELRISSVSAGRSEVDVCAQKMLNLTD